MAGKPIGQQAEDIESSTVVLSSAESHASESLLRDTLPPDTCVGEYELKREIGVGGGGTVYDARHSTTGQRVALKVLRPEVAKIPGMVTRFMREVEAIQRIRHPNMIEIYFAGELPNGVPYYAMELLEGLDLHQLLSIHSKLSLREALALLEPTCSAIHAAHQQGIIHRDIKANNIFVAQLNGERVVKLLDFGIAKMLEADGQGEGLTKPGTWIGTPQYMPPEQIRCEKLDARADIYALGVMIFRMLTGRFPFRGEPREVAMMNLQTPPPRPSEFAKLPAIVDEVVLKCLAKKPDQRWSSALDIVEALRTGLDEEGLVAAASGAERKAMALYLELEAGDGAEPDDEMVDDMANVLELAEGELAAREYQFPLHTWNALLGVLVSDETAEPLDVEDAVALARELQELLSERDDPHPDVKISISIRDGAILCRGEDAETEVVGGPLLEVKDWPAHTRVC